MENNKTIGLMVLAGLTCAAGLVYAKITSLKNFAKSIIVTPLWYGSISDLKLSTAGMKLPLALDLGNRSSENIMLRVNSVDIYNGDTIFAQSVPALNEVEIKSFSTSRLPIDMNIPYTTLVGMLGNFITRIANGESMQDLGKQVLDKVSGMSFRVDVAINGLVEVPIVVNMADKSVRVDGLGLVPAEDRKVGPLSDYEAYLPTREHLNYRDSIVCDDITPEETAMFIRNMARKYKTDTARLSKVLERKSKMDSVQNVFDFVFKYIKYVPDAVDREQVRRPLRTLYDQKGDCDCFSVLVASIFENLGIPYIVRIAEYENRGYYQHVYVVAKIGGGECVCDPVVHECFYEKPTTAYLDF
jgi:hypothetical protein